jgi:hypothetical protein
MKMYVQLYFKVVCFCLDLIASYLVIEYSSYLELYKIFNKFGFRTGTCFIYGAEHKIHYGVVMISGSDQ